jgi:hypothetical protein
MVVLAVAIIGLALFYVTHRSVSTSSSDANDALSLDPQASTTLHEGVDFAKWLAKEYPQQGN